MCVLVSAIWYHLQTEASVAGKDVRVQTVTRLSPGQSLHTQREASGK